MCEKLLYCKKCLIADSFFIGGGSWSSDYCPKCGGTECVWFENLPFYKKIIARKRFNKMWKEKWNLK